MLNIIFLFIYIQINFVNIVHVSVCIDMITLFSFFFSPPLKKILWESIWLPKAKEKNLMRAVLFFRFFLSLTDVLKQQPDTTVSDPVVERLGPFIFATLLCSVVARVTICWDGLESLNQRKKSHLSWKGEQRCR